MSRETGSVDASREAHLQIQFSNGKSVDCVLDTGFDGALMLPRALADELALVPLGSTECKLAGSTRVTLDVALGEIIWLGEQRAAEVIISDDADMLIGTELLNRTELTINYVACTVSIAAVR